MPLKFWPFAFTTATYLINRLPTATLNNDSPYFRLFRIHPNYEKLHGFGCLSYPWLRPYSKHKLESRSKPCIFIGYSSSQSAFHLLDPLTNRIYTSRHVHFLDHIFLYESLSQTSTPSTPSPDTWLPLTTLSIPLSTSYSPTSQSPSPLPQLSMPLHHPLLTHLHKPLPTTLHLHLPPPPSNTANPTPSLPSPTNISSDSSTSSTSLPTDHISSQQPEPTTTASYQTRPSRKPNPKYHNSDYVLYHSTPHSLPEPTSITQALKQPLWREAMQSEFDALKRNQTWTLVPPDNAPNLVGCKWVYRTKFKPDGLVDRLKSRLVAKGFHQRPGLDYVETFSPVVKPATLRLILAIATSFNWPLRQLDNAFLQGTLTESVYMSQPPGFVDPSYPTHVCKLNKAIYGLRQASRAWYNELKHHLLSVHFKPSISDPSLFINTVTSSPIFILVYVDDIIITGANPSLINSFIQTLATRFSLKDLGDLSYFLGIEVIPHNHYLFLSQSKYILDILTKANMSNCKSSPTPMSSSPTINVLDGDPLPSPTENRAFVGALQYLSLTRPDISFTVNKLSQFMH
ncbi:putative RNA-directed DNA polymerase [Helianthus annuus]|nr:putative RNA-directed DNA polymerase [Helianthus annuus]